VIFKIFIVVGNATCIKYSHLLPPVVCFVGGNTIFILYIYVILCLLHHCNNTLYVYLSMRHVIYPTVCLLRAKISHHFKYRIKKKITTKSCITPMSLGSSCWHISWVTTVMMTKWQTHEILRQEGYERRLILFPNMMYGNTTCKMSQNFYYENIFVECIMAIQPSIRTKDIFKFNVNKWITVDVLCGDNLDDIMLCELKYYVISRAALVGHFSHKIHALLHSL
jgi:hypothetical protein